MKLMNWDVMNKEQVAFQNRFGKPVYVINWSGFIDWLEKEFPHR